MVVYNLVTTFVCCYLNGQYHCIAIADNNCICLECNVGKYDCNCSLTNDFTVVYELRSYIALFTIGYEDTIFDCTEGSICKLPYCI